MPPLIQRNLRSDTHVARRWLRGVRGRSPEGSSALGTTVSAPADLTTGITPAPYSCSRPSSRRRRLPPFCSMEQRRFRGHLRAAWMLTTIGLVRFQPSSFPVDDASDESEGLSVPLRARALKRIDNSCSRKYWINFGAVGRSSCCAPYRGGRATFRQPPDAVSTNIQHADCFLTPKGPFLGY